VSWKLIAARRKQSNPLFEDDLLETIAQFLDRSLAHREIGRSYAPIAFVWSFGRDGACSSASAVNRFT
jgi:hypothetical protein